MCHENDGEDDEDEDDIDDDDDDDDDDDAANESQQNSGSPLQLSLVSLLCSLVSHVPGSLCSCCLILPPGYQRAQFFISSRKQRNQWCFRYQF